MTSAGKRVKYKTQKPKTSRLICKKLQKKIKVVKHRFYDYKQNYERLPTIFCKPTSQKKKKVKNIKRKKKGHTRKRSNFQVHFLNKYLKHGQNLRFKAF